MTDPNRYAAPILARACQKRLEQAGAAPQDAAQTVRALLHGSMLGTDSHGVRLIGYYADMLENGGVNRHPDRHFVRTAPATGRYDADFGLAHAASYDAMDHAVALARQSGIGAVTVHRSTHYGAGGAYALPAAEQGFVALVLSNSDPAVALAGGRGAFHGTNPIAMAAPVRGRRPWLLDMATSSIPFNRVKLFRSLGLTLDPDVALDEEGHPTRDAHRARVLQPLGGTAFGHKGAALAGVVTILSAILSGADPDPVMASTSDAQTGRARQNVGHIMLAIDPARFIGQEAFESEMDRYLALLHESPGTEAAHPPRAPGDIEWAHFDARSEHGIPVDPDTERFLGLSPRSE
ncbi:Ldh family oxidoreductase [Swaminathania salitolerans]|uniref:Oxidoreductase n=1 Tax=Swaminathania salitolerans TaxID=182838 RepID=A0A511BXD2_9PROT|nr:Ldh family oxidoreductase [Swaminathania salitolerans]GBQ11947.1 malate/L-lactate dehydrogenase [Swaminathania salitolerans LMG 21291]GEL02678.1 oxidoreductase [Swaminathania salitolerans]